MLPSQRKDSIGLAMPLNKHTMKFNKTLKMGTLRLAATLLQEQKRFLAEAEEEAVDDDEDQTGT